MCSLPVTFGGGKTIEYAGASGVLESYSDKDLQQITSEQELIDKCEEIRKEGKLKTNMLPRELFFFGNELRTYVKTIKLSLILRLQKYISDENLFTEKDKEFLVHTNLN